MKKYFVFLFAVAMLLSCWSGCHCIIDPDYKVIEENVVYANREVFDLRTMGMTTVDLKMDVIEPCKRSNDPRPLIVYFHGYNPICYNSGMKETYKHSGGGHLEAIKDFARDHGCVVAIVDYVSATLKLEDLAFGFLKMPPCSLGVGLLDSLEGKRNWYFMARQGKEAIRFLKTKANAYNFDPNNITVAGFSAGGGIASMIGCMDNALAKPAYAQAQPSVVYDSSSGIRDAIWNVFLDSLGVIYNQSFPHLTMPYPISIPRPDLGDLDGTTWSGFNSSVKNVVLFNTGMTDLAMLTQSDPRIFLFGSDQDATIASINSPSADPCMNQTPLSLFSQIAAHARSVGYQDGQNLQVMDSPNPQEHNYNYPGVVDAVWDFIK
jgi:hypothetical protein